MAIPVIDCHSDVSVDVYRRRAAGESAVLSRIHAPAYRKGGVVASVCTVGGDTPLLGDATRPYETALTLLEAVEADVAESDGAFAIATSAGEVRSLIARGVFAIVLAIEGAAPVKGDLNVLQALYHRGIRIIGLTWNTRNEIAVGLDSGDGGLTAFGRKAVARMNELGIVVDLSHASDQTFWDVAEVSTAPLYASHSNARAVRKHGRNVDDDQLRAIADTDGAVGLVTYADFISEPPVAIGGLLRHLDHFRSIVGDNRIVIGADFLDYALEDTAAFAAQSAAYNALPAYYAPGLESVSDMQNFINAMAEHGVPEDTVARISTENFLALLEKTQRGSAGR